MEQEPKKEVASDIVIAEFMARKIREADEGMDQANRDGNIREAERLISTLANDEAKRILKEAIEKYRV